MAEILTDSELKAIEAQLKDWKPPLYPLNWQTCAALLASHRALAAERDAAYKASTEIVETAVKTQDELGKRIRTLESVCEAALKMMRFLLEHRHAFISGYRYEIEKEVEQLEEAIKQ